MKMWSPTEWHIEIINESICIKKLLSHIYNGMLFDKSNNVKFKSRFIFLLFYSKIGKLNGI